MEENIRDRLLDCIGSIATAFKESKLEAQIFETVDEELTIVANHFRVTKLQALLVAVVFTKSYTEGAVEIKDLMRHFDCSLEQVLKYHDDFNALHARSILLKDSSQRSRRQFDSFIFNKEIAEQLIRNQPFSEIRPNDFRDELDLLKKIYNLGQQREEEEIKTHELFQRTDEIMECNRRFPLIEWVHNQSFDTSDTYFFLYLIWKMLTGDDTVDISTATSGMFDDPSTQIRFTQQILFGENRLLKSGLIRLEQARFHNDAEVTLTDHAKELLKGFGLKLHFRNVNNKLLIQPENIISKKLIYNESEKHQIKVLHNLLQEKNLTRAQAGMAGKGFPTGITVLFHGLSGTGKTESVLQLARQSKREIMQVDISRSKSMWFGESEKIIKRIFSNYRELVEGCKRMPILLFNEADAIISRRGDSGRSPVAQTENAMQNILLEETERFAGILFATTNLVSNIDEAFDRRFLFKLEFHKPGIAARKDIWRVKLPVLNTTEYTHLAAQYEFSGGQIDNVVRKYEMESMLYGEKNTFETIIRYCDAETLTRKQQPIGFIKK
jgi:AAA+ superfamily predicted ATPase